MFPVVTAGLFSGRRRADLLLFGHRYAVWRAPVGPDWYGPSMHAGCISTRLKSLQSCRCVFLSRLEFSAFPVYQRRPINDLRLGLRSLSATFGDAGYAVTGRDQKFFICVLEAL